VQHMILHCTGTTIRYRAPFHKHILRTILS